MNHLLAMPLVIPAITGALLLACAGNRPQAARWISAASTAVTAAVAVLLVMQAMAGDYQVYAVGEWQAPFGIVLVLDRLSAMLILLTAVVALAALAYAIAGWDLRGRHFHALFQFQLMGINGAFLTGDLFNLFVFFEVLLIASYCLLLHGLGQPRLRAAVHYVAINLTGSGVFLIAVSLLYGVTGTLNMAHLAERVALAPEADIALIRAAGMMLLGVFAVKAALFPLYFWLPQAYSSACAPVAALFAIMTKVGVYSILRVTSLVFGGASGAGADLTTPWLLPVALLTLGLAALGVLGARRLGELVAYMTIASVGTMLTAITAGGVAGVSGALFYLVHSTLVIASLFLLTELLTRQRGSSGDALVTGPALQQPVLLGIAFLIATITVAGAPPSSGFLAKLMILQATLPGPAAVWVWSIILCSSLLVLVGGVRAGSQLLWHTETTPDHNARAARPAEWLPLGALLVCGVALVLFAQPLQKYTDATAQQLLARAGYIEAVIGGTPDTQPRPLRPGEPR